MKIVRFTENGRTRIGKLQGDHVVDLSPVPGVGDSMRQLLGRLGELRPALEAAVTPAYSLAAVRLENPINDPQKYLAIGLNYKAHAEEARVAGIPIPTSQLWFNKQVSCLSGPYDPIQFPSAVKQLDYEIELGVVIGQRCRNVKASDARAVIAGYLVTNDVSARDWQQRSPTFTLGKSFDSHGPVGPWLTTDDEIKDPLALNMRLTVNGEERQNMSTGDMIYDIYQQIAYLSTVMTLEPGDILATGTPSGVGVALGKLLQVGDVVRAEIEQLGHIENRVVQAP
ncbi:fumarylacetoacetate hydrolase family protein [Pseudomonas sp. WS 5106]|uniref:Fumarylacetoacetate hydrolase family protein n=1 Tax=Pseudomonas cremoris TaxID=2724178 RepID=A0A7X1AQV5_9PSED|nr:fumarylacetoacetate hydrolase family protein [Pseudomonas cremoris]MBC2384647.1 fumarylacetoacetate hydrolase family protein [Pseudomonas cremoris]MBC2409031.1 fumarylacetoacetate hydrolase family protein [Pseudomonas cremoris]